MKKKLNKKGFTLAELLIVVAIIGILAAIAIPVFTTQMEKTRKAVDEANATSIKSMAVAEAMSDTKFTPPQSYYGVYDTTSNSLTISDSNPGAGKGYNQAKDNGAGKVAKTAVYYVTIGADYKITNGQWVKAK